MAVAADEMAWSTVVRQMLFIGAASLVFASAGALLAWPAAALPRLSASPPLDAPALSSAQGSWCVAALHAGQVLGAVPGAVLAARAGRRVTLLLCAPPLVAAWLLLAGAGALGDAGVAAVLGARALGGCAVGVAFVAGPLYAAEAASARLRGAAGALVQLALSAGQLLVYCGGAWLSLRHLALAAAALPVLFAAAFWCAPETPHWLLRRGERGRAERALRTLRGAKVTGEAMEEELAQLEVFACAEAECDSGTNTSPQKGIASVMVLFSDDASRRAMGIVMALVFFQCFSGYTALLAYSTIIFEISGSGFDSSHAVVVLGVILVVMSLISPPVIDSAGRRFCLLLSCSVSATALLAEGGYFFARGRYGDAMGLGWLPVVALVAYFIAFTLGLGPLPTAVAGELFPARARAPASAVLSIAIGLGGFAAAKLYQIVSDLWGVHVTMWIFGGVCLIGVWFSISVMPETKGKSFEEIQQLLLSQDKQLNKYAPHSSSSSTLTKTTLQKPSSTVGCNDIESRERTMQKDISRSASTQSVSQCLSGSRSSEHGSVYVSMSHSNSSATLCTFPAEPAKLERRFSGIGEGVNSQRSNQRVMDNDTRHERTQVTTDSTEPHVIDDCACAAQTHDLKDLKEV